MCNALDTDGEVLHFIAPNQTVKSILGVNDTTLSSLRTAQVCGYMPDSGLACL